MSVNTTVPAWWRWWYFGWQLVALVALSALLITFICGRIQRPGVILSLVLIFVLSCITNLLLLITNNLVPNPSPPFGLCLTQASLLMPTLAAQAFTILGLTSYVLRVALGVLGTEPFGARGKQAVEALEVGLPWVVWLILSFVNLGWGLNHRAAVVRGPFHCTLDSTRLSILNSLLAIFATLLSILIIITIGTLVVRSKRHFSPGRRLFATASDVDFALVLRILPFGIWLVLNVVVECIYVGNLAAPIRDMILTLNGAIVFLLLLQQDVLESWGIPTRWIPFSSSNDGIATLGSIDEFLPTASGSPTSKVESTTSRSRIFHPSNPTPFHPPSLTPHSDKPVELDTLLNPTSTDLLDLPSALRISRPMPQSYRHSFTPSLLTPTPTPQSYRQTPPPLPLPTPSFPDPAAATSRSIFPHVRSHLKFASIWKRGVGVRDKEESEGRKGWIGSRRWTFLAGSTSREERRSRREVERRREGDQLCLEAV